MSSCCHQDGMAAHEFKVLKWVFSIWHLKFETFGKKHISFSKQWFLLIQVPDIVFKYRHLYLENALHDRLFLIEGIMPKGPYLPCVSMAGRALLAGYHRYNNEEIAQVKMQSNTHFNSSVSYKTKFGSQNFGYQIWCFLWYIQYFKQYVQYESNNNEKIRGLPTVAAFAKNNFQGREKNIFFKVSAPMSLVKCHTPLDVKFHWAQCVKSNYNRMEPFPIGKI